jgi:hypothetical protein
LAARFVRDEEAAGSNPATPTSKPAGHMPSGDLRFALYLFCVRFWVFIGQWVRIAPPEVSSLQAGSVAFVLVALRHDCYDPGQPVLLRDLVIAEYEARRTDVARHPPFQRSP